MPAFVDLGLCAWLAVALRNDEASVRELGNAIEQRAGALADRDHVSRHLWTPHTSNEALRRARLQRTEENGLEIGHGGQGILYCMPRDLSISNGNLMMNFDHEYNIRDVYYPHVGQDNQTVGDVSFFGVWCDGKFAWIGNPSWIKTMDYDGDTLVTGVVARSPSFDLEMTINDTIDFDRDLFVRRVEI